jgi:ABC-type branched-subunit amino acid transport system ATPase component
VLEVRDVHKRFGGNKAVDGCSFTVEAQSTVGLIGPNGAGKTTTVNLISGRLPVDRGEIVFNGKPVQNLPMWRVARRGLTRTFQISRELRALTVMENMLIASQLQRYEGLVQTLFQLAAIRAAEKEVVRRAYELLELFQLTRLANQYAGNLSGGQKRLLELARSLMADPEMLILDEPLAGVNPTTARNIAEYIETMRSRGITLLIIEHNLTMVERLCERVIVMAEGSVLAEGNMKEIRENPKVVDAYLGTVV